MRPGLLFAAACLAAPAVAQESYWIATTSSELVEVTASGDLVGGEAELLSDLVVERFFECAVRFAQADTALELPDAWRQRAFVLEQGLYVLRPEHLATAFGGRLLRIGGEA